MEILVVGNKPTELKLDTSCYDMVCHINRMSNIMNIPRVDLWYCDCHEEFFYAPSNISRSGVKFNKTNILIPKKEQCNVLRLKFKYPSIELNNINIIDINTFEKTVESIGGEKNESNYLTSDVLFLKYMIKNYPNDNITLTCLDVYDRGNIIKHSPAHIRTWHENAGYDEEKYLINLINNNVIKYINDVPNIDTNKEEFNKVEEQKS